MSFQIIATDQSTIFSDTDFITYPRREIMYEKCPPNHTFFIALDKNYAGAKKYASFISYKHYLFLNSKFPVKLESAYEILKKNSPCIFHFDVDDKTFERYESNYHFFQIFEMKFETFWKTKNYPITEFFYAYDDASGINYEKDGKPGKFKHSSHIFVHCGFYFTNIYEHFKFSDDFQKFWNDGENIDLSIYHDNRCFLMINNTKKGHGRIRKKLNKGLPDELFFLSVIPSDYKPLNSGYKKPGPKSLQIKKPPPVELDDNGLTSDQALTKRLCMECINDWDDRNTWFLLGKSIYTVFSSKLDVGLDIWDDASQKSHKYEPMVCSDEWDKFVEDDNYGIWHIRSVAEKQNPESYFNIITVPLKPLLARGEKKKLEIIKKNEEKIKCTKDNTKDFFEMEFDLEITDQKYIPPNIYNNDFDVNIGKGYMGCGKTESLIRYLKTVETEYPSILILTPRCTYADSILSRYQKEFPHWNFISYKKDDNSDNHTHVVVQVESLHHRQVDQYENGLIIMDESESILKQMMVEETHAGNHAKNFDVFFQLLYNAKKIIALDAFITNQTLTFFKML